MLATASFDGSVGLWDLTPKGGSTPVLSCNVVAHATRPTMPVLSPDLSRLALQTEPGRIESWDVAGACAVNSHAVPVSKQRPIFFSADAETFVVGDHSASGLEIGHIGGPTAMMVSESNHGSQRMGFSADNRFVVVAHNDAVVRVYEISSGELRYEFVTPRAGTGLAREAAANLQVALSNHGRWLAILQGGDVLLNIDSDERIALPLLDGLTEELCFSADDRLLAVRCMTFISMVHLIDRQSGALLHTLRPSSNVNAIALSPDAKTLAVGASDRVTLWHTETGQEMGSLRTREESGSVAKLQFSADGRRLAAITSQPINEERANVSLYIW